eukprot:CAMPEP_0197243124 /NCGR_PEP_ID=MMETSP1429-20130617/8664_1 /TAXON_ID=49237 /ORGANISM="Chaetoceros  sp., Strain UNC1202" /LENGTH=269 /DNA_ID=CAMNT_0042703277 /DNA_START=107 /DNA_END=916 /DNA_ORIENTATION=+
MKLITALSLASLAVTTNAFSLANTRPAFTSSSTQLHHAGMGGSTSTVAPTGFIDKELRGAAMRLHTRSQSPKEGKIEDKPKPKEPHVPTHADYLKFLVDSQHVYASFEQIIQMDSLAPEMTPFCDTGLERSEKLEDDIAFITSTYSVDRPEVGEFGKAYASHLQSIASKGKDHIPELMCHYYNYYFAHTAGGRMIGKRMASLLLEKKTLEFYKWNGDINVIKKEVKESIEDMAEKWSREEKDMCVEATMDAFRGGGGINAYLSGGGSPH